MESKNRHVLGRSIVLERQERYSIERSERIYIRNTQLKAQRHHPNSLDSPYTKVDLSRTSISSGIEKIHRTRQRVDRLNEQINHEIDRLKEVKNHFKNRNYTPSKVEMKSNKQMTWGESFSANRAKVSPLATNRQRGPGQGRRPCECPGPVCKPHCRTVYLRTWSKDEFSKPALKKVKQIELTPGKPPPKGLPPKELPPKNLLSRELPPKRLPPKELPPKKLPSRELPPKGLPIKELPTKGLPIKELPPKRLPPKELPLKRLPPKGLLSKEQPPKELPTRIHPPIKSTQTDLNPGKPPPKEHPPRELLPKNQPLRKPTTSKPLPREEPMQKELSPEDQLARRVSGGCCHCYCSYAPSYCSTCQNGYGTMNQSCHCVGGCPSYNVGLIRGMQYGIPYSVSPRRQVTDLNTQQTCSNRCVGVTADRNSTPKELRSQQSSSRQTVSSSVYRSKSRENRSPVRGGRATENEKVSRRTKEEVTTYQMRSQEKQQKGQSQEKQMKVQNRGRTLKVDSREKLLKVENRERIIKAQDREMLSKKQPRSAADFKREKSKLRVQKAEVTDVVPPQALGLKQPCAIDERMYQDYLSLYYQENSKEDIREPEALKPTPTYTRLRGQEEKIFTEEVGPKTRIDKSEKPLTHSDRIKGQALSKSSSKEEQQRVQREVIRPQISPEAFTCVDQECMDDQSPSSSPESVPSIFSYKSCCAERSYRSPDDNRTDCASTRQTHRERDCHVTSPKDYLHPTGSQAYSQHPKSPRSQDKDRQQEQTSTEERVVVREIPKDTIKARSSPKKSQSPHIMESTSYESTTVKHQSPPPSKRQVVNSQTQIQSRKERPLDSFEKSSQVFQDFYRQQRNLSPESFGADSSRIRPCALASEVSTQNASTGSSSETIVINPHYQSEPKVSQINGIHDSDEESDDEPEKVQLDMEPHDLESLEVQLSQLAYRQAEPKEALRVVPEKVEGSRNVSPAGILRNPISNELKDSQFREKSDFQTRACKEAEEAFPRKPEKTLRNDSPLGQFQSMHNILRNVEPVKNEYSSLPNKKKDESHTEDIQERSECDGYESARSHDPNLVIKSQLSRSFSPQKGGEDKKPIVETVCEKRTRTVTFEDELGDLAEQKQVEEHCRSRIDWERALKYRLMDKASDPCFTADNYTSPGSSSSAEHTCIESSCDEGDGYDSCLETLSRTDQGMPPFRACPCMYETYRHLTALCQNRRP